MNKNTYLGLVLAASLSITSIPLLAEGAPAADSTTPETKIIEPLEPHPNCKDNRRSITREQLNKHLEALAKEYEKTAT